MTGALPLVAALAAAAGTALAMRASDVDLPRWTPLAAAGLAAALAVWAGTPAGPGTVFLAVLLILPLALLAATDLATRTVPDWASLALIATGAVQAVLTREDWLPTLAVVAVLAALALLSDRDPERPSAIGAGDWLMLAGIAAWVGPPDMAAVLILAALAAMAHLLALIACRIAAPARRAAPLEIAFAPSLAVAAAAVWLSGPAG